MESLKMSPGDSVVEHLQKLKAVINELEGVGEIVEDRDGNGNHHQLATRRTFESWFFHHNLCTQGHVRSFPFNDFEGLLLQEESLQDVKTSKGDSSRVDAINYKGKAPMQMKSRG